MRASRCLNRNLALTERAGFGGYCLDHFLFLFAKAGQFVDSLDQKENNKRHNEEVDDGGDKCTIADIHIHHLDGNFLKVGSDKQTNQGHQDIIRERFYNRLERTADNNADC